MRNALSFVFVSAVASLVVSLPGSPAGADEKPKPGTDGTVTSYDKNKAVLAVEACDKKGDDWDYGPCLKVLRERTVQLLCKKGPGTYTWSFQVGSEKSTLSQSTTCAGS